MVAESDRVVRRMMTASARWSRCWSGPKAREVPRGGSPATCRFTCSPKATPANGFGFVFHAGYWVGTPPPSRCSTNSSKARGGQTLVAARASPTPEPGSDRPPGNRLRCRRTAGRQRHGRPLLQAGTPRFNRFGSQVADPALRRPAADIDPLRRGWGFETAGAILDTTAIPLSEVKRPGRLILMLGNETSGLSDELTGLCDHRWTIPMTGLVDSINVSVAAGFSCTRSLNRDDDWNPRT
ncbi:MAG: hypothetical protein Ct9H300mP1_02210 [Planctomycetaceae bacterium]|nr:MAG: hypothetical protein Ct9H300mP1_02210 [Planctomycetaceae bacterium]